jgi:hypothetical protein
MNATRMAVFPGWFLTSNSAAFDACGADKPAYWRNERIVKLKGAHAFRNKTQFAIGTATKSVRSRAGIIMVTKSGGSAGTEQCSKHEIAGRPPRHRLPAEIIGNAVRLYRMPADAALFR